MATMNLRSGINRAALVAGKLAYKHSLTRRMYDASANAIGSLVKKAGFPEYKFGRTRNLILGDRKSADLHQEVIRTSMIALGIPYNGEAESYCFQKVSALLKDPSWDNIFESTIITSTLDSIDQKAAYPLFFEQVNNPARTERFRRDCAWYVALYLDKFEELPSKLANYFRDPNSDTSGRVIMLLALMNDVSLDQTHFGMGAGTVLVKVWHSRSYGILLPALRELADNPQHQDLHLRSTVKQAIALFESLVS